MNIKDFSYTESSIYFIWTQFRCQLFRMLTRNSTSLFLRGNDTISALPQISGKHEPTNTKLIELFAEKGYSDFLVDIGANIGLISCQVGQKFKEIHMYEPNPICCRILEANSLISLGNREFKIYEFGLGEEDGSFKLNVPRNNWGGAYIEEQNCYDLNTIIGKDRFKNFDSENYYEIQILVKSARYKLSELFSELLDKDLKCGVIKIDVEGYEPVILEGIADALPEDMKLQVIFESLDSNFEISKVLEKFRNRCVTAYILSENFPWKGKRMKLPNFIKIIFVLFRFSIKTVVKKLNVGDYSKGMLIVQVD
jgi:FkbM family methyltransferase